MNDIREFLNKQEAINLVGGKRDTIHCFMNPNGFLIGADWSWSEFEEILDQADQIELAGATAASMGHPLCVWNNNKPYFFSKQDTKDKEK